ncbi:hypothetical protein QJV46_gp44 [Serratia phage vB_SmaS_Opt-155]|uniref:Uncharacterized protein n=1 Tax=Serratia phage vB_SmaS_Opt-155 TaxID=2902690 RepID=A0AC61TQ13_9CAUD|nr:hypothetical protein QJV46_gp44 [Serratia phage vB_SmaS_Opt-155]UGO52748.1 hypothetical protein OPT155_44 [Serratia phage vB_SmaS_Opt-155]
MARTTKSKAKKTINVNFEGVESSGKHPEGRFLAVVDGAPEQKTSENSGNDYLNWKFKTPKGSVYHMTSLAPHALWNLKNVLEACGQEVPDGELELDPAELDGLELGIEVGTETYGGKKRARVTDVFPVEEMEESETEEEEETEEEGEEVTYAEVQEMDKDELIELAGENEIKLTAKLKKSVDALRDHICSELGLEEEAEEEEESEGPTHEEVQEMDKEELVELAEENEIKLTVKVKKNLQALRDFICEALELEAEEEEEEDEAPAKTSRKKTGKTKTFKKGQAVSFEEDGETYEGKIKSINEKDAFAVVVVDGEEWEVELADLS